MSQHLTAPTQATLCLDRADNVLRYQSATAQGLMVNISSSSLIKLYQDYADCGLFERNVRHYLRNKMVDDGIKQTLDKERENFWFYNNGVIITCDHYELQGDRLLLWGFSIVNGGQTTTVISRYKGSQSGEFFIPCRVISGPQGDGGAFFARVAATTAIQKPVRHSDLRSNDQQLLQLQQCLAARGLWLELKRGEKSATNCPLRLKKEELARLLLCLIHQRPGLARTNCRAVFEQQIIFDVVFGRAFQKDPAVLDLLVDTARLERCWILASNQLLAHGTTVLEKELLRQGKQVLLALTGVAYALINGDLPASSLPEAAVDFRFIYGPLLGGWPGAVTSVPHELIEQIRQLLSQLLSILAASYTRREAKGQVASAAAFMRSDRIYQELILADFAEAYSRRPGLELRRCGQFLRRPDHL